MSVSPDFARIDKKLLGEIYTSNEAWKNLVHLCDECGSRFPGARSEAKARSFIKRKMESYALEPVEAEPFRYLAWARSPKGASFRLLSRRGFEVPCISLPYSPATSSRGIEAELLNIGDGLPSDFVRLEAQIQGKIVLVTNRTPAYFRERWIHRAEKYGRAVRAGAVGFVYVNMSDGRLPETGCLRFNEEAETPGISISKEDYAAMMRAGSGKRLCARLITRDSTRHAQSANVVGDIRVAGRGPGLILGAHYDGHDITEGAGDNANGVAVLLEVARALAMHRRSLKRSVRFVCFGCEEIGLIGAHAYARRHETEMDDVRLMLNLDGVPAGSAKGLLFHEWPEMKSYVAKLSKSLGYGLPFGNRVSAYSDFFPFFLAGVPTAGLANPSAPSVGRGVGHTSLDTVEKIDPRDLREGADVVARVLLRVASDEQWPLQRRSRKEVERILADTGFDEILRAEGKEPFE